MYRVTPNFLYRYFMIVTATRLILALPCSQKS
jgi:hypothetical protein